MQTIDRKYLNEKKRVKKKYSKERRINLIKAN